jgi:hypothetical protein
MGDTPDDGSFAAFLAANPDQAAALATYQANNDTGDPNLQPVYYNPITKVYGPVTLPVQAGYTGPDTTTPVNTGRASTPSVNYGLIAAAAVALFFLYAGGGRR